MKKTLTHFLIFCCFVLSFSICFSQTTIVLQPDETTSKDATVWDYQPNENMGAFTDFTANAWTQSGTPSIARSLIDFDLSAIPSNATIISATLSLYYHHSTHTVGHSTISGSNACWLKRITSNWNEMTATWNNQPSTTTLNEVALPTSINDTMDYPNIDVTNLISDIYNNPSTGYGMMLMLQTEQYYRALLFASSGEIDPAKRPKLTVTYNINTPSSDTCIIIKLNNNNGKGKDATVWDYHPNENLGTFTDFTANAWTQSGTPAIARSLIDFDLSTLPSNAIITNATLSLYYYPSTSTVGHSTISGSNACWLKRITSNWNEMTVTWNNQPSTTTQNEVVLPASINNTMDYPNIDVTNLISDIYNNPSAGYGMMLMLQTEQYYRALLFGSSNCPDQTKVPILEVCYHTIASVPEIKTLDSYSLSVYPNPAYDAISIDYILADNSSVTIDFYNITGKLIDQINMGYETKGKHNLQYIMKTGLFPSGIYLVKISTNDVILTNKFIKVN